MKRGLFALLTLVLALGLIAGCGGDDDEDGGGDTGAATQEETTGGAAAGGGTKVSIGDNFFRPETITVKAGDTVTWTNDGQAPHTVTKEEGSGANFDSGTLEPGKTFEQTFDSPGDAPYVCTIHPGQTGTVKVE
jgi:plastocyanin